MEIDKLFLMGNSISVILKMVTLLKGRQQHMQIRYFHAIQFNLSNGVTDTLESCSMLIHSELRMGLNTQNCS